MKILLLSPYITPEMNKQKQVSGGIHTWTVAYLGGQLAKKNQVTLINTVLRGKRYLGESRVSWSDEFLRTSDILRHLKAALNTENYDIAHMNSNAGTFGIIRDWYCVRLIKKRDLKIVLHFHCNLRDWVKHNYSFFCLKNMVKDSDKVLVLNEDSKEFLLSLFPGISIEIMPNFLPECFNFQEKHAIRGNIEKIIYVGQLRISKGCAMINDIAKKYINKKFFLIGSMFEECEHISFAPNITLSGNVSPQRVREYMMEADLLLFPTFTEGFPMVVLEAMSCGLPILSTPVGSIPDMLEDKGGLLVSPGCLDENLAAIEELENPKLREKMSLWNKEKVKRLYSKPMTEQRILNIYQELVNK